MATLFDPLEWILLSDELANRDDEASFRTAIGRLYYAVFLKSRDSLTAQGWLVARMDDGDHRAVFRALQENRRGAAAMALNRLRAFRNRADYQSDVTVSETDWTEARAFATEVVRLCGPDWESSET